MDDQNSSESDAKKTLANPFYAVVINKIFSEEHETIIPEEDWVKVNAKLISEIGAEEWLHRLLAILKGEQ